MSTSDWPSSPLGAGERALAYGSVLMTCSTSRANGAMLVVGSQRPNTLPSWTSQAAK